MTFVHGTLGSAAGFAGVVAFGFVVAGGAGFEVLVLEDGGVVDVGALEEVGAGIEVVAAVVAAALPTAAGVLPPPEHAASASVATSVDIPTRIFFTAAFPCQSRSSFLPAKTDIISKRLATKGHDFAIIGYMPIVVDYQPSWPQEYERSRDELLAAAGGLLVEFEHIGSTSVPGLNAKPVIDMAAVTPDLVLITAELFAPLGYAEQDFGAPGRLLFVRRRDGERTHHLHIFPPERWELLKERMLAAHLRKYPEAARRYGELKRQIIAAGVEGDAYTVAKTDLIQELTDAARAERGLPPEPVWEG